MVIIISAPEDAHIDFVTPHLKGEYTVIDAGQILNGKGLTYALTVQGQQVIYEGRELKNVTGIWLRRPRSFENGLDSPPVAEGFRDYTQSAVMRHMKELYSLFPKAVWLSGRYEIEQASAKLHQLTMARHAGFLVPETCITSDPLALRRFIEQHGEIIIKSMSRFSGYDEVAGVYYRFYARRVCNDEISSYKGLEYGPVIAQTCIEPAFDIRVTVVGEKVFATKLEHGDISGERVRDWHITDQGRGLVLSSFRLPKAIQLQCLALVRSLGLRYGAIDLVKGKDGAYWFIEINPNGQWAFVEQETGQPIGREIARLLEQKRFRKSLNTTKKQKSLP